MGPTAQPAPGPAGGAAADGGLAKLGFVGGLVVMEFGYDSDVDDDLRFAIEDLTGFELEDDDYGDVADAAVIWYRKGDWAHGEAGDDLVDTLVDAMTNLAEGGFVVLLTPKAGRPEHVDPSEIEESAVTAGLHTVGGANVATDWSAVRLVAPKGVRR